MFAAYADFGIGLAIVNTIAVDNGGKSSMRAQRAISVAWFFLLCITLAALAIVVIAAMVVSIVASPENSSSYYAMLLGVGLVALGLPTGIVQRVMLAQHKIALANVWVTGAKLLSLICLWLLVNNEHSSLYLLVFSILGIPVLVGWVSVYFLFKISDGRLLAPKLALIHRRLFKHYAALGALFLTMQVVPYIESGIDPILVGSFVSLSSVQSFDLYSKLYLYVPALISIAALPLWPLIAHANKKGDYESLTKLSRLFYFGVFFVALACSSLLIIYDSLIINKWVGKDLQLDFSVRSGFALFVILASVGYVQTMILTGLGFVKQQVKVLIFYLSIALALKVLFVTVCGIGGMIWIANLCFVFRIVFLSKLRGNLRLIGVG